MKVIGRVITRRRVKALAGRFTEPQINCETSAGRAPRPVVAQSLPAPSDTACKCACVCACSTETQKVGHKKHKETEHARDPESNASK
jgi:hypothetical protein